MTDQEIESLLDRIALGDTDAAELLSQHIYALLVYETNKFVAPKSIARLADKDDIASNILMRFTHNLASYRESGSSTSRQAIRSMTSINYIRSTIRNAQVDQVRNYRSENRAISPSHSNNEMNLEKECETTIFDHSILKEVLEILSKIDWRELLESYLTARPADARMLRSHILNPSHAERCEEKSRLCSDLQQKTRPEIAEWLKKCERREAQRLSRLRSGLTKYATARLQKSPHLRSESAEAIGQFAAFFKEIVLNNSLDNYAR